MNKGANKLFEKVPCNTGRQIELDIGKALPVLCLPFVHCVIECCTEEQLLSGVPFLFDSIIGGPLSAPMFLFCMGATINYSSHTKTPGSLALRGLKLIGLGFLLNLFRIVIPFLIGWRITGDTAQYIRPMPFLTFGNDVLMFAGMCLLCLALVTKLRIPKWGIFVIALTLSVIGTLLRGTDMNNDVLNVIFGWFIGTVSSRNYIYSEFTLFNWLIIPTVGYLFGGILRRVRDKKRFYLCFSPTLLALVLVYFYFGIRYDIGMFGEGENAYYHLYTYDAFACLAVTLGLLGFYASTAHLLPLKIRKFLCYVSSNITAFYCIHWVFVRVITNVILYAITGSQQLPVWAIMLVSLCIMLLTLLVLYIYRELCPKEREAI